MTQLQTDYEQTHQRRLFQVKIAFLVAGFDLKRFHSEMIGNGAMGLAMLRVEMAERL